MGDFEEVELKQHRFLCMDTFASLRNSVNLPGILLKQPRNDGKLKHGKLKHPWIETKEEGGVQSCPLTGTFVSLWVWSSGAWPLGGSSPGVVDVQWGAAGTGAGTRDCSVSRGERAAPMQESPFPGSKFLSQLESPS